MAAFLCDTCVLSTFCYGFDAISAPPALQVSYGALEA